MKKITSLIAAAAMTAIVPAASQAQPTRSVDLNRMMCLTPDGYKLDFSGTGRGGNVSGVWVNQRFVGHWRVRSGAIVVDWQMVDEGGQSERIRCKKAGKTLTCRNSGTHYKFKCRRMSDGY